MLKLDWYLHSYATRFSCHYDVSSGAASSATTESEYTNVSIWVSSKELTLNDSVELYSSIDTFGCKFDEIAEMSVNDICALKVLNERR